MAFEVQRTLRGYRMKENGSVLSEILSGPGATNSVFDVLAAAVAEFSPGPEVGLLGFAGGGLIAPLRQAGSTQTVHSVDLDRRGYELFQKVSASWCGPVSFVQADAMDWLRSRRGRFDAVIEDLSIPVPGDVEKPDICWTSLPPLIRQSLKPGGTVILNMLKSSGMNWPTFMPLFANGYEQRYAVHLTEFENRILIAGSLGLSASMVSRRLRRCLRMIGSDQADQFRISTLK